MPQQLGFTRLPRGIAIRRARLLDLDQIVRATERYPCAIHERL